jgi:NAD(P)H-dependent FMN reductase
MNKLNIQVILGSTRENRFGIQPAEWIVKKLQNNSNVEVELIDLRDWNLPFFNEAVSPSMNNGNYTDPLAAKWAQKIGEADGYIWVAPEYNHGYSAVLKNALDYVYREWHKKPVSFVAYGTVGGARAVEQLRQVAVELQMAPIRQAVHIQNFWSLLDSNGKLNFEGLEKSADDMIENLIWWGQALKKARTT